jgi:hypothetical protein
MAQRFTNRNPLTTTIIVFAVGDGYTVWEAITRGTVSPFTVVAWIQGLVLLFLYLTRSRFAGSYLFYSIIPIFPVYFGLKLAGLYPPPARSGTYVIAFVIYAAAVALLWKQKRDYAGYLAAVDAQTSQHSEAREPD